MNIQDKQPQTVYVPVSVAKRLPDDEEWYGTLVGDRFNNDYKPFDSGTTYWLSPQTAVLLSVEEWERVKKCIKTLERVSKGYAAYPEVAAKQALQQLNQ